MNQGRLCEILEGIAEELSLEDVPRAGKTGRISCSIKFWGQYAERSPFLSAWVQLEEISKLCQFFAGLKTDRIHPRYTTLVRTGRTSCHGPNIQQLPRSGGFREMIVPSEGTVFLGIDYSAIELRTLAAVLERRYGRSRLAEVLRDGVDPHSFTASMFRGVSLEEFSRLTDRIANREAGEQLSRDLFFAPVVTLTGRLRGKVGFSQSRNTPFQGIAADGAMVALWGLYRAGFRVVAFIHDEFLIELPIRSEHTEAALRVDRILCESMEQLTGSVPISCEYALSDRWYKAAEAIFDEDGKLCLWDPQK